MLNLKINYVKSYLPLKSSKGTTPQRLSLARDMNDKFCETLKSSFNNGTIAVGTFKRILKKAAGAKIPVEVTACDGKNGNVLHLFDDMMTANGYMVRIPIEYLSGRIKASSTKEILATTQRFFDELCNSKFYKRITSMLNKGADMAQLNSFWVQKVMVKGELTSKDLDSFLRTVSKKDRIDTLQALRYSLFREQNSARFVKDYMRKVNQNPSAGIRYGEDAINTDFYRFNQKIKLLEEKLASELKKARTKK